MKAVLRNSNQIFALLMASLGACAHAPESRFGAVTPPPVLATLGQKTLGEADLPDAIRQRLSRLDDVYVQERFNIVWAGLEDSLGKTLLQAAAKSQGLSLERYVQREIDDKVGTPSAAEITGLYEANRELIGVPFADAEPALRKQYLALRRQALERAVVDQLRAQKSVTLSLTPPTLSRQRVETSGPSLGVASAPVALVVFSDFACPYSAQARRLIKRLNEIYADQLFIVHRHLPLERHANATSAAYMAVCAAEQQKFWPFAELLYENGARLGPEALRHYAHGAELNDDALNLCLRSARPKNTIAQDRAAAEALGVVGTPALFLNGMYIRGVVPLPVMCAYIDAELRRQGLPTKVDITPRSEAPGLDDTPAETPAAGPEPFDAVPSEETLRGH